MYVCIQNFGSEVKGEQEALECCGLDHFDGYGVLQTTYISDYMKEAKRSELTLSKSFILIYVQTSGPSRMSIASIQRQLRTLRVLSIFKVFRAKQSRV